MNSLIVKSRSWTSAITGFEIPEFRNVNTRTIQGKMVYNIATILLLVYTGLDFVQSGRYARWQSHEGQLQFIEKFGPWILQVLRLFDKIASLFPALYTTLFAAFTKSGYNVALGIIEHPMTPEKWLRPSGVDMTVLSAAMLANASGVVPSMTYIQSTISQLHSTIEKLKNTPQTTATAWLAFFQQVIRLTGLQGTVANVPGIPLKIIDYLMVTATVAAATMIISATLSVGSGTKTLLTRRVPSLVVANRQSNRKPRNPRLL